MNGETETEQISDYLFSDNKEKSIKTAILADYKGSDDLWNMKMFIAAKRLIDKYGSIDFYLKNVSEIDEYYLQSLQLMRSLTPSLGKCRFILVTTQRTEKTEKLIKDGVYDKFIEIQTHKFSRANDLSESDIINEWFVLNCDAIMESVEYRRSNAYFSLLKAKRNNLIIIEI